MKKFSLLSAAAVAALGAADGTSDDPEAGPEPGKGGSDQAKPKENDPGDKGAAPTEEPADGEAAAAAATPAAAAEEVPVVAADDVKGLIAQADAKGFDRANARMSKVFDSKAGAANPADAAFLLANSTASADAIITKLEARASAAPAAAGTGIPDTNVRLGVDPKALADEGSSAADIDKGWDDASAAVAARSAPLVPANHASAAAGGVTVPALPRTGN